MAYFCLDYAPCPPFFVDDIYNIFITTATENGLNETDIEYIRVKCSIEIPTTTTTTTTTTPEPPTTTSSTSTTEETTTSTTTETTLNTTSSNVTSTTTPITSTTLNVTDMTSNVTMVTGTPIPSPGCGKMCIFGIVTSASCLAILIFCLIGIAIFILFRKGRDKRHRSTSRSRTSRFADMPNTDFYDSVDIDDSSSKRNSGSSFLRRSGDYSKTPLTFDNPGYRRSFELRPHRYNSWYDPEATDYEYSQNNAYLVPSKSRAPERRSMSASRLNDKHSIDRNGRGSFNSLHNYVPKVCNLSDAVMEPNGQYKFPREDHNVNMPNRETANSPGKRGLPRTQIEKKMEKKSKHDPDPPRFKYSYRSRSFDPDYYFDRAPRNEPQYYTVDNRHSKTRNSKGSSDKKGGHVSRKDKNNKSKASRVRDNDRDRIDMYNRPQYHPNNFMRNDDNTIISSNLNPSVAFIYKGPIQSTGHSGSGSKSYRERNHYDNDDANVQYRHHSYKPRSNGVNVHVYQTKL